MDVSAIKSNNCPLVSIIIPVFNVEKYLGQCLTSILSQTYSNIEVICVNDGSQDNSLAILKDFASKDSRIKILSINNAGVSNARNLGLNYATGSRLMFVDADDWIDSDCVECLVAYSILYDCEIVMFPYVSERKSVSIKRDLFQEEQLFVGNECRRLSRLLIGPIGNEVTSPIKLDSYGTVWGKLYNKEIMNDVFFVDLKKIGTAEDTLFNTFIFKRAKTVGYCSKTYYHYRRSNTSSLTGGFIPKLKDKRKELYKIIADHFVENDEKEALSNRIALDVLGLLIIANYSDSRHKEIKELLQDDYFNAALKSFNTTHFPFHWKLFYLAARKKCVRIIELFLLLIRLIRGT